MGLLLNQSYWATHIQNLINCRPGHGRTMSAEQTAKYLDTLCMAFSDLAGDQYLTSDIQTAFAVIGSGNNHPPAGTPSFMAFIEVYERAERTWLMQCGMDIDSAADIIEAIRPTYPHRYDFSEGPERIVGRIATAARVCCHEDTRSAAEEEKLARAKEMQGVFSGIVTLCVDIVPPTAAVVAQIPWIATALGPIGGFSVKSGLQAIIDGTKRWF